MKALLIAVTLITTSAYGQVKPVEPKVIPTIPEKLQSNFYKEQANLLAETLRLEENPQFRKVEAAKAKLEDSLQAMLKTCGGGYNIQVDPDTGITCKEIVELPKPPEGFKPPEDLPPTKGKEVKKKNK